MDVILGNLNSFLTKALLAEYDKVFCLGHMTLYKNNFENNRVFMHQYKGNYLYKRAFTTDEIVTFDEEWRDENNINRMFISEGRKVFTDDFSMNPSIFHNRFIRTKYVGREVANDGHGFVDEDNVDSVCVFDDGHLFRYGLCGDEVVREEFAYMHLQKRKMKVNVDMQSAKVFKIIPDEFSYLEVGEITKDNFSKIRRKGHCLHLQRLYLRNVQNKIKKLLCR